jgi:hypothetical protein
MFETMKNPSTPADLSEPAQQNPKRPFWKKKRFMIPAGMFAAIGAFSSATSTKTLPSTSTSVAISAAPDNTTKYQRATQFVDAVGGEVHPLKDGTIIEANSMITMCEFDNPGQAGEGLEMMMESIQRLHKVASDQWAAVCSFINDGAGSLPSFGTPAPTVAVTKPMRAVRTYDYKGAEPHFDSLETVVTFETCKETVERRVNQLVVGVDKFKYSNPRVADGDVVWFVTDPTTLQVASNVDVTAGVERVRVSFVCETKKGSDTVTLVELNGDPV